MSKKDYYATLGVSRDADEAEIKKAYRRLTMKHHPDRNEGDKKSTETFKSVVEAYEVLSDPQKRHAYDHGADPNQMGGGPGGFGDVFNDIFSDIFGGGGAGGRRGQPRGADLRYNLELSLEEEARGTTVTITVPTWVKCKPCQGSGAKEGTKPMTCHSCHGQGQIRIQQGFFSLQQRCPTCQGSGQTIGDPCRPCRGQGRVRDEKKLQVKVPPGVDQGDRVRLTGEGEAAPQGGIPGDLYVEIHTKEHPIFQREGHDLYCEVPINFVTAALGGELEVPTLDSKIKLHVPPETQTGKVFKLTGRGVRSVHDHRVGDLLCRLVVETPISLNKRQKELLQEFQNTIADQTHSPRANKWFDRVKVFFDNKK